MVRFGSYAACVLGLVVAALLGRGASSLQDQPRPWQEVLPGLLVSPGSPRAYALIDQGHAIVFDAPRGADLAALRSHARSIDAVYLTHHQRDVCAQAEAWIGQGIPVHAPKTSADWLQPDKVAKFWQEAVPLRNSRTAYLVVPVGIAGIQCTLVDGQDIRWRGWTVTVTATPGHSPDHVSYVIRKGNEAPTVIAGDAIASPGKMWTPYVMDWDHWTDLGQKPAAESLRKLAALQPRVICPAHGEPIKEEAVAALERTARAVAEVAFLKSYERFSKERLGNPPAYAFLAREQAGTAGEKPWSQLSPNLYLTGNTYVLVARDKALAVIDPWGKRSVEQVARLQKEKQLGPVELVTFSHAHFDHYDGVYDLPERDKFQVWTLDRVAEPIAEPFYYRAPFLDARPVRIDRRFKDGETGQWREYGFKFHHFPGQSYFTMAMETVIDGKKCFFTADNFFHVDLYSGTGGWMGLNRSWPSTYATSAAMVLKARPDWILSEHGGACEFHEEDWRRRVAWGEAAAAACDAICPSGHHRQDWDPHRIHVEPFLRQARPGEILQAELAVSNPLDRAVQFQLQPGTAGVATFDGFAIQVAPATFQAHTLQLTVRADVPPGRHVVPLVVTSAEGEDGSDVVLVIDVVKS